MARLHKLKDGTGFQFDLTAKHNWAKTFLKLKLYNIHNLSSETVNKKVIEIF